MIRRIYFLSLVSVVNLFPIYVDVFLICHLFVKIYKQLIFFYSKILMVSANFTKTRKGLTRLTECYLQKKPKLRKLYYYFC